MEKRRSRGSGKGGGWLTALVVGAGVVGAVYWAVGRSGGRRRKRMGERNLLGPTPAGGQPRSMLRESIIGADKGMVQSVFGPPRAAGGVPVAGAQPGRQAYWEADTWYYALDPGRKVAMAITFKGGVVREVEFVEGQGGAEWPNPNDQQNPKHQ